MPRALLSRLRPIYVQVLIALAIAVVVGMLWPEVGLAMKPLGDGFIALLKILIGPIIFCTIVTGLTQIRDLGRLGRVVVKAFIYFEIVSTLALIIGMIAGNVFQPGAGMHVGTEVAPATARALAGYQTGAERAGGFVEFLLALIPRTFVSPFADGEILQTLLLSVMFGAGALLMGDKAERTIAVIAELQKIFFRMIAFIMYLAPLGAFGAMAYTVGLHGGTALVSLGKLILLVYGSCIVFIFVVLGAVSAAFGFSIFRILKLVREEFLLVLGTSSSEVALPRLIEKLERAGCERSIVGLVLPTGYSFNTDGTSIYMSMAMIFISQATDTPLTIAQQLGILAVLLFTSKGGAAVSGAGFVKLAATLQSVKTLPLSGLGVLIGVDRFMSEARSITNMIGNAVATLVVARWEGAFDQKKFDEFMKNPNLGSAPLQEPGTVLPAPDPRPVITSIWPAASPTLAKTSDMTSAPRNPPFRADQVGSLLRPAHLIEARQKHRKKLLDSAGLKQIEDDAIRKVVAQQEAVGLHSISDGEFRRQNYLVDFFRKALGPRGLSAEPGQFVHRNEKGETIPIEKLVIHNRLSWSGPIFAEHFAFLKSITRFTPKTTIPSPVVLHFLGGSDAILREAYSSLDAFWSDLIEVYRRELVALHAAGCTYLQVDETSLVKFGDPDIRTIVEGRGDDWRKLVETYVEVINAVLSHAPPGMTVGIHVCRGNRRGFWQAAAGYEFMAEQLFRRLKASFYFLEFDSPRAGPLDALRLMPDDKTVVLGLVSTKSPQLETKEMLRQRINEAAKYVPLARLGLSPQCGFSGNIGNTVMTADEQMAKLRLVVETARSVWDDA